MDKTKPKLANVSTSKRTKLGNENFFLRVTFKIFTSLHVDAVVVFNLFGESNKKEKKKTIEVVFADKHLVLKKGALIIFRDFVCVCLCLKTAVQ